MAKRKRLGWVRQERSLDFVGEVQLVAGPGQFHLALLGSQTDQGIDDQPTESFKEFLVLFVETVSVAGVDDLHYAQTACPFQ